MNGIFRSHKQLSYEINDVQYADLEYSIKV